MSVTTPSPPPPFLTYTTSPALAVPFFASLFFFADRFFRWCGLPTVQRLLSAYFFLDLVPPSFSEDPAVPSFSPSMQARDGHRGLFCRPFSSPPTPFPAGRFLSRMRDRRFWAWLAWDHFPSLWNYVSALHRCARPVAFWPAFSFFGHRDPSRSNPVSISSAPPFFSNNRGLSFVVSRRPLVVEAFLERRRVPTPLSRLALFPRQELGTSLLP